jgi:hypothetical protein
VKKFKTKSLSRKICNSPTTNVIYSVTHSIISVRSISSLIFFSVIISSIAQSADCDLKRDDEGIKVYTCKTGNEKLKSLRAEFDIKNTTFGELKVFLWNVNNYVSWQYNTLESEQTSENAQEDEMVFHSIIHAPWPLQNRELLARTKVVNEGKADYFFMRSIPYDVPKKEGLTRVALFDASWTVVSEGTNLKVVYSLRIDPGGAVPPWLVNLAMAEGPYLSFKKLKAQLEK